MFFFFFDRFGEEAEMSAADQTYKFAHWVCPLDRRKPLRVLITWTKKARTNDWKEALVRLYHVRDCYIIYCTTTYLYATIAVVLFQVTSALHTRHCRVHNILLWKKVPVRPVVTT